MARCTSCNAELVWRKTTAGKNMPLDAKQVSVATPTTADPDGPVQIVKAWVPHWSTCPSAAQHRRPKPPT